MNTVNPFATLETLQSHIHDLAHRREILRAQRTKLAASSAAQANNDLLAKMAGEVAVLDANILRTERHLREAQQKFIDWEGDT